MNMTYKDKFVVADEFKDLFNFKNEEEELNHETSILMLRFIHEMIRVYELNNGKLLKKDLAAKLGTSASYITQLFRGDKNLNFPLLAKFQKAFDVEFKVNAVSCKNLYTGDIDMIHSEAVKYLKRSVSISTTSPKSGTMTDIPLHADYNKGMSKFYNNIKGFAIPI